jgi:hypothetical protein
MEPAALLACIHPPLLPLSYASASMNGIHYLQDPLIMSLTLIVTTSVTTLRDLGPGCECPAYIQLLYWCVE